VNSYEYNPPSTYEYTTYVASIIESSLLLTRYWWCF